MAHSLDTLDDVGQYVRRRITPVRSVGHAVPIAFDLLELP